MLLSKTDKIRFKLLYPEYSHNKLAIMFNTNREDIIGVAKGFGIYDSNKVKDEPSAELKSEKKYVSIIGREAYLEYHREYNRKNNTNQ